MTKNKHHIVFNKNTIIRDFNRYDFQIVNYIFINNGIMFIVHKDYSKGYNIPFNGLIELKVKLDFRLYSNFCSLFYPKFIEISNLIPKSPENHIYIDESICYAPPQRPIDENWGIENFIIAVDAMINNYFSIEYIGKRTLVELEHGKRGIEQYILLKKNI